VLAIIHDQLKDCADYYSVLEKITEGWGVEVLQSKRQSSVSDIVVPERSTILTVENMAAHRDFHRQLSSFSIREVSLDDILEKHKQAFQHHPLFSEAHREKEKGVYFHGNWLLAVGTALSGSYVAAAFHTVLAATARFGKSDTSQKMKLLYEGLLLTSGVSIVEGSYSSPIRAIFLTAVPVALSLIGLETGKQRRRLERRYSIEKQKFRSLFGRDYTPALERIGNALDVGYRSLRYIGNVCTSERQQIDVYADQIERLDSVLFTYLQDGQEEDLRAFKVTYRRPTPRWTGRLERPQPLPPIRKSGYTPAEYEELRRAREEADAKERASSGSFTEGNIDDSLESYQQRIDEQKRLDVLLSSSLQEVYGQRDIHVDGFPLYVLIDSSREKIQSRHKHTLVREKGSNSRFVVERLREKYGLPEDAKIFKLNTRQGVRCLYTMSDGTATMLEVIDHRDYQRLFDLRY